MERKGFDSQIELKSIEQGIVSGYLASFNTVDSDGDIFAPTAFNKSINERGPKGNNLIKYLLDHDQRKALGYFIELKADDKGLYYEAQLGTHRAGMDFKEMVKSKIINQHSVGFKTVKRDPKDNRIISEAKLLEGSALQFLGANPNTPLISIKSENDFSVDDLEFILFKLGKSKDVIYIKMIKEFLQSVEGNEADSITSKTVNPTESELKEIIKKHFTLK